jgi:ribonuclease Z
VELKFIGTGSGKTSLKRYHSSFLINSAGFNLLVDSGDGISHALLKQKVIFNFIDGVLISHLHADHYTGLPGLIVQMKMSKRVNPLSIFCHESYYQFLKEFIYQSYLFEEKLGFKVDIRTFQNDKEFKLSDEFSFNAKQNSHLAKNLNIDNSGRLGFSCSSFLFDIKGKKIFYTGDVGESKDLYLFQNSKIDWMISEITHISIEELIEAFRNVNPQKLFITHLSDEDEERISNLPFQLPIKERQQFIAAFDGLSVNF